ncbi:MAG: hypothetical protein AABX73_00690 [Nanoarchaeota archaeon]
MHILLCKGFSLYSGTITAPPKEHRKTLEKFEKLAASSPIDKELVQIYKEIVIKAEELRGTFIKEKSKRGKFTYRTLP